MNVFNKGDIVKLKNKTFNNRSFQKMITRLNLINKEGEVKGVLSRYHHDKPILLILVSFNDHDEFWIRGHRLEHAFKFEFSEELFTI